MNLCNRNAHSTQSNFHIYCFLFLYSCSASVFFMSLPSSLKALAFLIEIFSRCPNWRQCYVMCSLQKRLCILKITIHLWINLQIKWNIITNTKFLNTINATPVNNQIWFFMSLYYLILNISWKRKIFMWSYDDFEDGWCRIWHSCNKYTILKILGQWCPFQ